MGVPVAKSGKFQVSESVVNSSTEFILRNAGLRVTKADGRMSGEL